ncbi:hypothetical protein D9M69_637210 [compost metagenome]
MDRILAFNLGWQTYLGEVMTRTLQGFPSTDAQHAHRALNEVFQHRHVAPQIEVLKHHR